MILILEMLFTFTGFWLLINGNFPSGLNKTIFKIKRVNYTPAQSRLLGLILITPLFFVILLLLAYSYVLDITLINSILIEVGYVISLCVIIFIINNTFYKKQNKKLTVESLKEENEGI